MALGWLFVVLALSGQTMTSLWNATVVAIVWSIIGRGLLKSGYVYLSRYRFKSTIAFVMAEGTIGRSEVKAGKGWNDSFESANLVVRSDSTMRLYAASLLTETLSVDETARPGKPVSNRLGARPQGPQEWLDRRTRYIIRADRDSASNRALKLLNEVVDAYERAGIVVRPIEPTDGGLNQMAQANLAFQQASALATGGSARLGEAGGTTAPFQLPRSASSALSAQADETKICPMCAETVKAAALKCRFCGHMFEA